ncbi:uncharacterized protein [Atheta coriaria]|uniref:uncharacterized protein n=1 Tax=Dalotia coriaria TaxID=877792 RepID=UPI0031F377EF
METYLNEPDVFDYVTFATILIGILCNILIIDTIIHKLALRSSMRLIILSWAICDLFYLFNTTGFLHFLLRSFGLHVTSETKLFIFQPHLLEESASSLLLQMNCLILMWLLAFSSANENHTTAQNFVQWFIVIAFIIIDLLIVFLNYDLSNHHIDVIRRGYISLLVLLLLVNEFHYFQLMCNDDSDIDIVLMKQLKINIIRVYVYNWCFVYFMRYVAAYGFHEAVSGQTATKYFYAFTICLTLTAFLTGFYVLIHLLCNDIAFRKCFICSCTSLRRGDSINADPNELSAIITGARYHYLYHRTEVM